MSTAFTPGVGVVFSADIAAPEHERVVRFYSRVLCTGEEPLWREDLMNNRGMPIIGLGARGAEHADLPLQWMAHIQVADVATSVERALDLGGRELMHGRDDAGNSQWAVLLDRDRAAFGIIPVVPAEAMPAIDGAAEAVGRIAWLELTVSDPAAARDFYRQVIGWAPEGIEMEHRGAHYTDYHLLGENEIPAAAIRHARGANAGLPPVWMIHLPVRDLAESLRRVAAEGGKVIQTRQREDGQLESAAIQDPIGASLVLRAG